MSYRIHFTIKKKIGDKLTDVIDVEDHTNFNHYWVRVNEAKPWMKKVGKLNDIT